MPGSRMQISNTGEMVEHEAAGEPWAAVCCCSSPAWALAEMTPTPPAGKDCRGRDAYDYERTFYVWHSYFQSSGAGVLLCTI